MTLLKRISILIVILLAGMTLLCGCNDNSDERLKDRVVVGIKAEYKEKFLSEEFTTVDFNWENTERIEYHKWYENNPEVGYITVYLKKHGIQQIESAAEHFRQLEFVASVGFDSPQYLQ